MVPGSMANPQQEQSAWAATSTPIPLRQEPPTAIQACDVGQCSMGQHFRATPTEPVTAP